MQQQNGQPAFRHAILREDGGCERVNEQVWSAWAESVMHDPEVYRHVVVGKDAAGSMLVVTTFNGKSQDEEPPLVWGTMVWQRGVVVALQKYPSRKSAEEGHERWKAWAELTSNRSLYN